MPNFVMDGTGTVCVLSGRTYTKVNPGRAIVGVAVNSGGYIGPLLVSEMADAVTYSATSGGPWAYESTILHKGVTYYVNAGAHFMAGTPSDTSGLDRYLCSASGLTAAAEELLNAYERSTAPTAGQIADYTGTVYNGIDKIYYFDGTSFSQIGKMYDYDGTANSLIYSAEEILFENGVSGIAGVPAMHAYHTNGSYVGKFILSSVARVELCHTIYTYVAFPAAVDFSKYSKLKARVKKCGSNENVAAVLGANVSDYWGTVTSTQALYNLADGAHFEITVDVSGFNSKTRPWFGLATTNNSAKWAQVEYEKIWLE